MRASSPAPAPPASPVSRRSAAAILANTDVLLDFTAPEATLAYSELAAQARIVHVIGTTGIERRARGRG